MSGHLGSGRYGPAAGRALAGLALLAYPMLVWVGLTRWSPRVLALVLLAVLAPLALGRMRGSSRQALRELALLPIVTLAMLACAAILDAAGVMLVVPVVTNALLLIAFAATLRRDSRPMVERFARLHRSDLTPEQQAWCRGWTRIWSGFFVLNGGTALLLALFAPLDWWAFYNGMLAYVLMGLLFAGEWLLRRRRFGPEATGSARNATGGGREATRNVVAHGTAVSGGVGDDRDGQPAAADRVGVGDAAAHVRRAPDERRLPDAPA